MIDESMYSLLVQIRLCQQNLASCTQAAFVLRISMLFMRVIECNFAFGEGPQKHRIHDFVAIATNMQICCREITKKKISEIVSASEYALGHPYLAGFSD